MHATQHSRTAEFMAFFRALETARPANVRLFSDPWAKGFLGSSFRALATAARLPAIGWALRRFIDHRWPGARSSGVARTCFIDEAVNTALEDGFSQVVLLGAGFDSRAYRLPFASEARIFEIDHPNTSHLKRQHVETLLGNLPRHVTFVAADFNRERLGDVLRGAGVDFTRPVFFVWEGVSQYLTAEAVDATFRDVATSAAGSKLLFTYVHRDAIAGRTDAYDGMAAIHQAVNDAAEPWTFGFEPGELPDYLAARGYRLISDLGAADYRALYRDATINRARGYEFYRIAVAEVLPHGPAA